MPVWNAEEGLYILTEAEERAKTNKGLSHVLTREDQSLGGRSGRGDAKRRSPEFYAAHNSMRGRKGAAKRWGTPLRIP